MPFRLLQTRITAAKLIARIEYLSARNVLDGSLVLS
jgi:hypothetical protein